MAYLYNKKSAQTQYYIMSKPVENDAEGIKKLIEMTWYKMSQITGQPRSFFEGFLISATFTVMPEVSKECMTRVFSIIVSTDPMLLQFFLDNGADPSYCIKNKGCVHVLSIVSNVETLKKHKESTFVPCKSCNVTHDVFEGFTGNVEAASVIVERSPFGVRDSYPESVKQAFANLKKKEIETPKPVEKPVEQTPKPVEKPVEEVKVPSPSKMEEETSVTIAVEKRDEINVEKRDEIKALQEQLAAANLRIEQIKERAAKSGFDSVLEYLGQRKQGNKCASYVETRITELLAEL